MALIKCSECGKEFSDKASACPNCACPNVSTNILTKGKNIGIDFSLSYKELSETEKKSFKEKCLTKEEKGNISYYNIGGIVFAILGVISITMSIAILKNLFFLIVSILFFVVGYVSTRKAYSLTSMYYDRYIKKNK